MSFQEGSPVPKIERISREISFHEKMFFGALAAMFAIISWLVTNYETANLWIVALGACGLLGAAIFGIDQYRRIKRLLEEMEKC
jgi:Flp pilus assembly protein TadB